MVNERRLTSLADGSCSLSTGEIKVEWPRFRSLKADASSTPPPPPPLLAIANLKPKRQYFIFNFFSVNFRCLAISTFTLWDNVMCAWELKVSVSLGKYGANQCDLITAQK